MQLGRAFSFIFEDEEWLTKTLINAIVNMIPIVNFAAIGWSIQLITNVMRDDERPMPGWDDFGKKFEIGLSIFVASIVYNLVLIILICCMALIPAFLAEISEGLAVLFSLAMSLVAFIVSIIANAALLIGIIEFTYEENLSVFWRFGYNFREALSNISILLMLFLFAMIAGLGIGIFGWIPCIGWLLAAMLAPPVMGHLTGQAGQQIMDGRDKAKRMA